MPNIAKVTYMEIMKMIHLEETAHPDQPIDVFLTSHPNLAISQIGRCGQQTLFFKGKIIDSDERQTVLVHFSQCSLILRPRPLTDAEKKSKKPVKCIGFVGCPSDDE
jgi:hypothetical protein